MSIDGKNEKVLPREVAFNVVSEEPIHIDFLRIVAGSKIILEIPVKFKNHSESPGLKRGGVLNIVRRKVELKCPTDNIPDEIVVDLAGTDIGDSLKITSVKLSDNVMPTITDRDFVIATVAPPTIIKEPEKPAEGEAAEGAEGSEATPAEGAGTASPTGKEGEAVKAKDGDASKKDEKAKDAPADKKDKKPAEKTPPKKK